MNGEAAARFVGVSPIRTKRWGLVGVLALTLVIAVPLLIDASGFDRHTKRLAPILAVSIGTLGTLIGAALLLTPVRVEVGSDGISIAWFRSTRVPFSRLRGVEAFSEVRRDRRLGHLDAMGNRTYESVSVEYPALRIQVDRASHVVLFTPNSAGMLGRDELIRHITNRRGEQRAAPLESATQQVARGERTLVDWVRDLRALEAPRPGGMRTAPVDTTTHWELIESSLARPLHRAAAAIAVGRAATDAERDRIRGVAAGTVAPALRKALERAVEADVDEATLAACLEAVDETSTGS